MAIVKITYSAELEEVPTEVSKILSSVSTDVEKVNSGLKSTSSELSEQKDVNVSIMKLENTMKQLDVIEAKIRDCHSILTGYRNILQEQKQMDETTSTRKKTSKQE